MKKGMIKMNEFGTFEIEENDLEQTAKELFLQTIKLEKNIEAFQLYFQQWVQFHPQKEHQKKRVSLCIEIIQKSIIPITKKYSEKMIELAENTKKNENTII